MADEHALPNLPAALQVLAQRGRSLRPSDFSLLLERFSTHAIRDRMSPADFLLTVRELGFVGPSDFATQIGLPVSTVESWCRFGLSPDAAALLTALASYRRRLLEAIEEFDGMTHVGLADFFASHHLP